MGPLVVGAVFVEGDGPLVDIGVRDSKKLTPRRRERMYDEIVATAGWTVVIASAEDIDSRRKTMSLNDVELHMFAEAVSANPVTRVYADCPDVNEASFSRRLGALVPDAEIIAKHKADDSYPVVSAASIVAKVTRDRQRPLHHGLHRLLDKGERKGPRTCQVLMGACQADAVRQGQHEAQRLVRK